MKIKMIMNVELNINGDKIPENADQIAMLYSEGELQIGSMSVEVKDEDGNELTELGNSITKQMVDQRKEEA